MTKYIIGLGLVIALGVLFAAGGSQSGKRATEVIPVVSAPLVVVEEPFDFGDIDIFGGTVTTTFTLQNNGTEDVSIVAAVTSCACTEGEIDDLQFGMHESTGAQVVVPAGGTKELVATFDPLAHGPNGTGRVTRELYLSTNSTVTPEVKAVFTGNVVKYE
tara:strand:- start:16179 stop:16658 length:480 start_codon:yes stop_codon:yes gene_type:complete